VSHLTTFRASTRSAWVRLRLFAGGSTSTIGELGAPILDPLPIWPKPVNPFGVRLSSGAAQHLWLVATNDVYQRFTSVSHTTRSWPPTALVLAVATFSLDSVAIPIGMRDTFVPRASHPTSAPEGTVFLTTHASVGYRWQNTGSNPATSPCTADVAVPTATCTTSCRTLTALLSRRAGAGKSFCHRTHRKRVEQLKRREISPVGSNLG